MDNEDVAWLTPDEMYQNNTQDETNTWSKQYKAHNVRLCNFKAKKCF